LTSFRSSATLTRTRPRMSLSSGHSVRYPWGSRQGMAERIVSRAGGQLVTGALALVAVILLAPGAAHATCGDYVVGGLGNHVRSSPMPGPSTPPDQLPSGDRAPCSGPMCSEHPAENPLAPSLPLPPSEEVWGCLPDLVTAGTAGTACYIPDGAPGVPVAHTSSVYHPPRASEPARQIGCRCRVSNAFSSRAGPRERVRLPSRRHCAGTGSFMEFIPGGKVCRFHHARRRPGGGPASR
jgi:hypothetical protein